jgi:hypothetical protein
MNFLKKAKQAKYLRKKNKFYEEIYTWRHTLEGRHDHYYLLDDGYKKFVKRRKAEDKQATDSFKKALHLNDKCRVM